ncbi:MAG: response regulator [Anaerolineae bacterium]
MTRVSTVIPTPMGEQESWGKIVSTSKKAEQGSDSAAKNAAVTGMANVLVVDDNQLNCDLLSRHLISLGYLVVTSDSGARALELLNEHRFDLVLLDVDMPGLTGADVLRLMKASDTLCDIPVTMIGADEEMDEIIRCVELGAADYLLKPFKTALLRTRINALLEQKSLLNSAIAARDELLELHRAARDVNSTLRIERIAEIMLQRSLAHANMPAGFVAQVQEGRRLVLNALQGERVDASFLQGLPLTLHQLGLKSCDLQQPRWLTSRDERIQEAEHRPGLLENANTWVIIPIQHEGMTLAVMVLEDVDLRRCDGDCVAFFTRLAEHAANALWNARLYASVNAQTQKQKQGVHEIVRELKLMSTTIKEHASTLDTQGTSHDATKVTLDEIRSDANFLFSLTDLLTSNLNGSAERLSTNNGHGTVDRELANVGGVF